jgi:hypothetical protein
MEITHKNCDGMNCTETVSSKHYFAEAFLHGIMCRDCAMEIHCKLYLMIFIPISTIPVCPSCDTVQPRRCEEKGYPRHLPGRQ